MGMTPVHREVRCLRGFSGHSAWVCMLMLGLSSEGDESAGQGALPHPGLGSLNTLGVKGVCRAKELHCIRKLRGVPSCT